MTGKELITYILDNCGDLNQELKLETFHPDEDVFITLHIEDYEKSSNAILFTHEKIYKMKELRKKIKKLAKELDL